MRPKPFYTTRDPRFALAPCPGCRLKPHQCWGSASILVGNEVYRDVKCECWGCSLGGAA